MNCMSLVSLLPDGSSFQGRRHAQGTINVTREHGRRQPVLWAVGPVDHLLLSLKLHDALNRPEDLQNTHISATLMPRLSTGA